MIQVTIYDKITMMSNIVLESLLKPLEEFYKPSFVEEIAINHAGEVWMRLHGARVPWVSYQSEELSKQYLVDLIHTVANIYAKHNILCPIP